MRLRLLSLVCSLLFVRSFCITDKEYAKLPPVFHLDDFERCLLFEDEALYCNVEYHLKPKDPEKPSLTWQHIRELSENPKHFRHDNLRHGICIPLSCPNVSKEYENANFRIDLAHCMDKQYEDLGIYGTIEDVDCQTAEPRKFDLLDILAAILIIVYLSFIIYSTIYEGIARYKTPEEYKEITMSKYGRIISCFSITRNWERLKTVEWSPDNVRFKAIQGVRFYNSFIVIFTHAALLNTVGPISNTKKTESMYKDTLVIFLSSGPYGVATFFLITAMLVTYNNLKTYNEKSGRTFDLKTILWIVLYRYIRLTPSMFVLMLFHATILNHAGRGPLYDMAFQTDKINCRINGWRNLLYIINWFPPSGLCLAETWYLSVDMQLFVLLLIILYFTVKNPKRFIWTLIGIWIVNQAYLVWNLYEKSIYTFLRPYPENMYRLRDIYNDDGVWFNTMSYLPMHLSNTFVGAGLGYLILKYEKISLFSSRTGSILTWFGIFGVALGIVFFPGLWLSSDDYYDSYWFSIPHLTLAPAIYSSAIALGAIGVITNSGWMVKWVLEWPPVYFLGRISYATYLAHNALTFYILGTTKNLISLQEFSVAMDVGKLFSMSLLLGLILALTVEYPISAVSSILIKEKLLKENKKNDTKNKISQHPKST